MAATRFAQPKKHREVGFTKRKGKIITYSRPRFQAEGWYDATKCLPMRGDLLLLQMQDRIVPGWWAGAYWYGIRIKPTDVVSRWKLMELEEHEQREGQLDSGRYKTQRGFTSGIGSACWQEDWQDQAESCG